MFLGSADAFRVREFNIWKSIRNLFVSAGFGAGYGHSWGRIRCMHYFLVAKQLTVMDNVPCRHLFFNVLTSPPSNNPPYQYVTSKTRAFAT